MRNLRCAQLTKSIFFFLSLYWLMIKALLSIQPEWSDAKYALWSYWEALVVKHSLSCLWFLCLNDHILPKLLLFFGSVADWVKPISCLLWLQYIYHSTSLSLHSCLWFSYTNRSGTLFSGFFIIPSLKGFPSDFYELILRHLETVVLKLPVITHLSFKEGFLKLNNISQPLI